MSPITLPYQTNHNISQYHTNKSIDTKLSQLLTRSIVDWYMSMSYSSISTSFCHNNGETVSSKHTECDWYITKVVSVASVTVTKVAQITICHLNKLYTIKVVSVIGAHVTKVAPITICQLNKLYMIKVVLVIGTCVTKVAPITIFRQSVHDKSGVSVIGACVTKVVPITVCHLNKLRT